LGSNDRRVLPAFESVMAEARRWAGGRTKGGRSCEAVPLDGCGTPVLRLAHDEAAGRTGEEKAVF
jgi:hypothetical protein